MSTARDRVLAVFDELQAAEARRQGQLDRQRDRWQRDTANSPPRQTREHQERLVAARATGADALLAVRLEGATSERMRLLGILGYAAQANPAVIRRCLSDPSCTPEVAARLILDDRHDRARAALAALAGDESAFRAPSAVTGGTEVGGGPSGIAARVLRTVRHLTPDRALAPRS